LGAAISGAIDAISDAFTSAGGTLIAIAPNGFTMTSPPPRSRGWRAGPMKRSCALG
jgi:hypothetical protein